MTRLKQRLAVGAGVIALAFMAGASTEAIARAHARRDYPPLGRLIDIGGRRIQLDCRGTGQPTIVLESGLDVLGSLSWAAVHDTLAATTRTCAYSRAGVLWSDPSPLRFSSAAVAADLRATLMGAGESAPFVLVAHSIGGLYAMKYVELYRVEVSGLVLVDASHPDQVRRLEAATGTPMAARTGALVAGAALARTGILRLVPGDLAPPSAPAVVHQAPAALLPISLPAMVTEAQALPATFAEACAVPSLGNRPLVVLTSAQPMTPSELMSMSMTESQGQRRDSAWQVLQEEEAAWSANTRHESFADASHYIQFDRPDGVVRAVREVVAAVRQTTASVPVTSIATPVSRCSASPRPRRSRSR